MAVTLRRGNSSSNAPALRDAGAWETTVVIGRENQDHGIQHDIAVVLAPNAANKVFNDYLMSANKTGVFPETPLPDGIKILTKITVVRR